MPTVHQRRVEGKEHFEAGRLDDAIHCFLDAVDLFTAERSTRPEAVEEFVKAAGNLCVCYHSRKDYDTCFQTARELLGIYPVIPKAFGAMGMCIMDRLTEQREQQQATAGCSGASLALGGFPGVSTDACGADPAAPSALRAALHADETRRRDPHRYVTKLAGILCTVDEAHEYLCRAVLLSDGALQVSLGPHIETAVRHINEQFISACHALERQHGDGLLDALCPPEESLAGAPVCLSTAPVAVRDTVLSIDPAHAGGGGQPVPVPRAEAAAILADAAAKQRQQQHPQRESPQPAGAESTGSRLADFALSGKPTAVRVCHAERGGLPRGLTLLRAERPFAVAAWLTPSPSSGRPERTAAAQDVGHATTTSSRVEVLDDGGDGGVAAHRDPTQMAPEAPTPEAVAQHFREVFGAGRRGNVEGGVEVGAMDPRAPRSQYCSHCGKEVAMQALMTGTASCCATCCGGAAYCSAECRDAYEARHRAYECKLRVRLQELVARAGRPAETAKATGAAATTADAATEAMTAEGTNEAPLPANLGEETPGASWTRQHFLHCVLPLSIAVYGGLCAQARGHEQVLAQLSKGVPRWRIAAIPAAALAVMHDVAALMEEDALPAAWRPWRGGCEGLLQCIALMVRLHQCPPPVHGAHEDDRSEHPYSFLFTERLLFRHSCEANCRWVSTMRTVVTNRFVCKGEELTLAVETNEGCATPTTDGAGATELFPQHWPWQIRRKWLLRYHAFDCGCARCEREALHLNTARGDLSSDTTEQLLSGDRLRRPRVAFHNEVVTHPTHFFHLRLHKAITEARRVAATGGRGDVPRAIAMLTDAAKAAEPFLLPTHYLFEDVRTALARVAAMRSDGEDAEETNLRRKAGGDSLLFWESLWAGAIPAKVALMDRTPPPADTGSRRRAHLRHLRTARAAAAASSSGGVDNKAAVRRAAATDTSATAVEESPEKKAHGPSRRRRQPPRPDRDFSEGTIPEHFYGSYQLWYA